MTTFKTRSSAAASFSSAALRLFNASFAAPEQAGCHLADVCSTHSCFTIMHSTWTTTAVMTRNQSHLLDRQPHLTTEGDYIASSPYADLTGQHFMQA